MSTASSTPPWARHLAKCPEGTRPLWAQRDGRGPRSILYVTWGAWADAERRDRDRPLTGGLGPWAPAYDHRKGRDIEIAVAPCELGCRCAAAWREVTA
jgi:hypothetical protein